MKFNKIYYLALLVLPIAACTNLDETLHSSIRYENEGGGANGDPTGLLVSAYKAQVNPLVSQDRVWSLNTHTTDEAMGPTRGGDWDDNGIWRVLHNHKWNADHGYASASFNELALAQFAATTVLDNNPSAQQAAEAKFLRAHAMFYELDLWDQVPFRAKSTGDLTQSLPETKKGVDCANFLISELNDAIPNLPSGAGVGIATKDAARALLMKLYLNKGVYANRTSPSFDAADMNKVVEMADQILGGSYTFSSNYFDNFSPNNTDIGKEIVYAITMDNASGFGGGGGGGSQTRYYCTLHYNQNPSGWNGFTTLGDFYDKFEDSDLRKKSNYTGYTDVTGTNVGFLYGQQYNAAGVALDDRKGNKLAFTKTAKLKETGNDLEITGIRVLKYVPDLAHSSPANNDYVVFKLSDIILMKAEAILRGATPTNVGGYGGSALELVNYVRTHASRGASALGSISLDVLIDERGRELYWEGWRRNDLIRFGKFLDPMWEKNGTSGPERVLFPIPNPQLTVNPNLQQNSGY